MFPVVTGLFHHKAGPADLPGPKKNVLDLEQGVGGSGLLVNILDYCVSNFAL